MGHRPIQWDNEPHLKRPSDNHGYVAAVKYYSERHRRRLDDVLVFRMEELPHQVRLANLTGPRDEEGTVAMLVSPRGELLKRFSPQHGYHLMICIFPSIVW